MMLLCRWNNQQVKLSTKQRVVVSTWDNKKQLCITSPEMFSPRVNRQSKKINAYLGQLSARLNQFYDENYSSSISLNQAKSAIQKLIEEILVIDKEKENRFKMTPIHHHFEMSGFSENRIVITFSLFTLLSGALALVMYLFGTK